MDLVASRTGWSMEYIDELEFPLLMALVDEIRIRPHFMFVNDEENEDVKADEELMKKLEKDSDYSWSPKTPTVTPDAAVEDDPYAKALIKSILKRHGASDKEIEEKSERISAEGMAIHEQIDEYAKVLYDTSASKKAKNKAMLEINALRQKLDDMGLIVNINVG